MESIAQVEEQVFMIYTDIYINTRRVTITNLQC